MKKLLGRTRKISIEFIHSLFNHILAENDDQLITENGNFLITEQGN